MSEHFPEDQEPLMAGDFLRSLSTPDYPEYILRLLGQLRNWLTQSFSVDGFPDRVSYDRLLQEDPEQLYGTLNWLEDWLVLLPSQSRPPLREEALVLGLGEANLDDIMRLAVDYGLIFARERCRRIWIVSDCWIPFDVNLYSDHLRALAAAGLSLRFLMVTPWGWLELPVLSSLKLGFRRFSLRDYCGDSRRREDDGRK